MDPPISISIPAFSRGRQRARRGPPTSGICRCLRKAAYKYGNLFRGSGSDFLFMSSYLGQVWVYDFFYEVPARRSSNSNASDREGRGTPQLGVSEPINRTFRCPANSTTSGSSSSASNSASRSHFSGGLTRGVSTSYSSKRARASFANAFHSKCVRSVRSSSATRCR